MGKAAQRKKASKGAPAGDVHKRIADEARAVKENPACLRDADETPALKDLIDTATAAFTARVPSTFEHQGKTYYMRVSIGLARVKVFETAAAAEPMTTGIAGSYEEFGHKPFH